MSDWALSPEVAGAVFDPNDLDQFLVTLRNMGDRPTHIILHPGAARMLRNAWRSFGVMPCGMPEKDELWERAHKLALTLKPGDKFDAYFEEGM